ncbi:MAG: hypothetical protein DCC52_07885 [Chloroflexi bacterium]|nr:MAG: hypothetical protein DCC52_07885 [Chloroflexota bacterium]
MQATADIVIIGGGCMGASVAYHLAARRAGNIVLLEREKFLAMGSTGRNAGGVRHQFSTPVNIQLSNYSLDVIRRFQARLSFFIELAARDRNFQKKYRAAKSVRRVRRRISRTRRDCAPRAAREFRRRSRRQLLPARRRRRPEYGHADVRQARA